MFDNLIIHTLPSIKGVCFTSAGLNKYVLVEEDKTWYEAQEYCRSRIGDLATVTNMEDLNLLSNMTAGAESWIGLNDFNRKTMDLYPNSWRWSNQTRSRSGYMNFVSDQPDYWLGKEECVTTGTNGTWNDDRCSTLYPFVCFSGKNKTKPTHVHTLHSHRGIQTYRSTTPCFVLLSLTEIIT